MTKINPLISVIIGVYNGDRYLAETIESILAQTYQPIEIIIVDDGSTDRTAEIAQSFLPQIKYFYKTHDGISATLNYGINLSQGDFIAFLDADDLWIPEKLNLQMEVFNTESEIDVVFGNVQQFISPELDEAEKKSLKIRVEIIPGYFKGTMLVKREVFNYVGLFNTSLKVADFIDWYLKLKDKNLKTSMLTEIVTKRRIHKNNMGIREKESRKDFARAIKTSLDRRRNQKQNDE
ncbi:glycosyltransferase [Geminocystis sp. NIES-3709]|uniref:glycosyltransferase family 2 protein n=1 Tax=Geminocystis sp. NIES-3709 TaxID=1617448 RepID=UPI0005FC874A|nr:glycosyltransferase [Geminocystis sp. NIES-3709]BAQ64671.1 probable glycosyl transferase [Geminocystis sp. NIES-3709]